MSASSRLRCFRVSPSVTTASSRILMLTSWSEQLTPPALSIASSVDRPAGADRLLDAAALRQAEVAALPDDAAAELAGVDTHGVVGLVATSALFSLVALT